MLSRVGAGDWREQWDIEAQQELEGFRDLPAERLLESIEAQKFGEYSTIWTAIAERATLPQAGWRLCSFLESDADYHQRYHCARALLRLLDDTRWQPVELSAEWGRSKHLADMRRALEQRIGPRPAAT
jgi:hypothetical protein